MLPVYIFKRTESRSTRSSLSSRLITANRTFASSCKSKVLNSAIFDSSCPLYNNAEVRFAASFKDAGIEITPEFLAVHSAWNASVLPY